MIQSSLFYVLGALAIIIVGISKSGFGSGLGVLAVPLMSFVIPPAQAAAILLPILCVVDLFNVWHYRRSWDKRNLLILVPAAWAGILAAALFFHYLSDEYIRILIGVIAIIFGANYFFGRTQEEKKPSNWTRGGFWGFISGFVSFGIHAGGPPANVYLLSRRLKKSVLVGTAVVFFTIVNFTKLIPYALLGQLNGDNLLASLLLAPFIPVGIWLGLKLHDRVSQKLFYKLAYFFLVMTGIKLLYEGITGLSF
jgi:hypothetical protein